MVNEITHVGVDNVQGFGRAAQTGQPASRPHGVDSTSPLPSARIQTRNAAFANIAAVKDEAAMVAQSVRKAADALAKAQHTVRAMQAQVEAMVKQYPPFPPGSEQRLSYLNSISALRQQLESMTIPPPPDQLEPVYYPRESDLPALDPDTASDEDVLAFAWALDAVADRIDAGLTQLEGLVEALPAKLDADVPIPAVGEGEALEASRIVAGQLPGMSASVLSRDDRLAQLGG